MEDGTPQISKTIRHRVDPNRWPGVYFYESDSKRLRGKPDVCYYVTYKVDGRKRWEKIGWKSEGYTPQVAAELRSERIKSSRHGETVKTAKEIRLGNSKRNIVIGELAKEYFFEKGDSLKGIKTDLNRWKLHLEPVVGKLPITDISPSVVGKISRDLRSQGKAEATIWNTIELLRRVINFGIKTNRCPLLAFTFEMPTKDNEVIEYLTSEQASDFMKLLSTWPSDDVPRMLKLAMFTGLRRGEIFKLQDSDIDYTNDIITLRNPKGGKTASIPMNTVAKGLLEEQVPWRNKHFPGSTYLFPGQGGNLRTDCRAVYRIKKKANLPENFRIFHGLRHHYAVTLANSGQVTLDMIGELLTHKSQAMTKRYAQFLPSTMREASNKAAELLEDQISTKSTSHENTNN